MRILAIHAYLSLATVLGGCSTHGGDGTVTTPGGAQPGTGGAAAAGNSSAGSGATGAGGASPHSYELPPPDRCHDQFYIPYDYQNHTGCLKGDATTDCGGKCEVINACLESQADKPDADVTFVCPRFMLFSPEMEQAAIDDGNAGFHYAVVGHDVDANGIDGNVQSACCQCYQLVYAYPSPNNDRQALVDPDNPNPPVSAVQIPPPLIVQSFNTGATPTTFDVYMAAGGLGANNACYPVSGTASRSGQYLYTGYPSDGQPSQGGVKPASLYQECKTSINWVTTETLGSSACTGRTDAACNQLGSSVPGLTEQARHSCIQANTVNASGVGTFYHLNWSVYVAKVECPAQLTRVTGCRLAPQGLPAVLKDVKTAAEAAQNGAFWSKTGSSNNLYETTTMEDCCRPSCAAIDLISGKGLTTDGQYRAFYSCDGRGVPYTQ